MSKKKFAVLAILSFVVLVLMGLIFYKVQYPKMISQPNNVNEIIITISPYSASEKVVKLIEANEVRELIRLINSADASLVKLDDEILQHDRKFIITISYKNGDKRLVEPAEQYGIIFSKQASVGNWYSKGYSPDIWDFITKYQ